MDNILREPNTFEFHIDGEHQIQAELLSNILYSITKLTEIIAEEVGSSNEYKLNVYTFEKGSFEIGFILQNIISGIDVSANIITCLIGAFELKKHLKGKKARRISEYNDNTIKVENNYGNIIIVPESSKVVISNEMADYHISNISNNIKIHNSQSGFTISSKDMALNCSSEDVEDMALNCSSEDVEDYLPVNMLKQNKIDEDNLKGLPAIRKIESEQPYVNVFDAKLIIKKPDILGDTAWEFILENKKIKAKILDEEWLSSFRENDYILRPGCYISASVRASYKKDSFGNPTGRAIYRVIKVYGNIKN